MDLNINNTNEIDSLEMTYALMWTENTAIYSIIQWFVGLLIQLILIGGAIVALPIFIELLSLNTKFSINLLYIASLIISALLGYTQSSIRYYETTHRTKKIAQKGIDLYNYNFTMSYSFTFTSQFNGIAAIVSLSIPILFALLFIYPLSSFFFPLQFMILVTTDYIFWKKYYFLKIKNKSGFRMYLDLFNRWFTRNSLFME